MSMDYAVFDSLQDCVLVADSAFGVHYANQAASNLLDASVKRLKNGKALADFIVFKTSILGDETFPQEGFSPTRELEFTTTSQKVGALQVNLQIDPSTASLPAEEKRWVIFLRDVSLEKILHKKYMGELDQKENVIKDLRTAQAQLEDYSKNLELKVEQRTIELRSSNRLLAAILDSLDQGIIVFERSGQTLPFFSKTSRKLFVDKIENSNVVELLSKSEVVQNQTREWLSVVFDEVLDFEDIKDLGPSKLDYDMTDREIALHYNPMRDLAGKLQAVVMVATDQTNEIKAKRDADHERSLAKRVMQITKFRTQFRGFAKDAIAILARLVEDTQKVQSSGLKIDTEIYARDLHTFKGGAATFSLNELATETHHAEELLLAYSKSGSVDALVDSIINIQLGFSTFLEQNKELYGGSLGEGLKQIEISDERAYGWLSQLKNIGEVKELYNEIENLFLREEIGSYFKFLDESLSELALSLGKKLNPLILVNPDLRIEGKHYRELFANLIHVFRNAIDHGLEEPINRREKNKSESGSIQISFQFVEGDHDKKIKIVISDDGGGIDANKIRERMKKLNYSDVELKKSDQDTIQIIFDDCFSSREEVSEISGRGVGLASVKSVVEKLGGSIHVQTVIGESSQFEIEVPFLVDSFAKIARKAA